MSQLTAHLALSDEVSAPTLGGERSRLARPAARSSDGTRILRYRELQQFSDHALLVACRAGDAVAHDVIYLRFARPVRAVIVRILGRNSEVDDVVQNVFLCVIRQLSKLRDPAAFKGFVMSIALRKAFLHQRTVTRRRRALPEADAATEEEMSSVDVMAQFALSRASKLIEGLSERDKAAFMLRRVAGLRVAEIARILQTSKATVQRRVRRAAARVRVLARTDPFLAGYVA